MKSKIFYLLVLVIAICLLPFGNGSSANILAQTGEVTVDLATRTVENSFIKNRLGFK